MHAKCMHQSENSTQKQEPPEEEHCGESGNDTPGDADCPTEREHDSRSQKPTPGLADLFDARKEWPVGKSVGLHFPSPFLLSILSISAVADSRCSDSAASWPFPKLGDAESEIRKLRVCIFGVDERERISTAELGTQLSCSI